MVVLLPFPPFSQSPIRAAESSATYTRFCASCGLRDVDSFSSQSRQFVVHGNSAGRFNRRLTGDDGAAYLTVEPQLVAMMAERVKRALLEELSAPSEFKDKIHITVMDLAPPGQLIGLLTQVHTDGFQYKMSVPGQIESRQLLKGLLQALLLEYSNRGARRCAELPNWIVEGMLRQIQTAIVPNYVVNRTPVTIETSGYDRLGATRAYLQTNTPLTMQELSFADLTKVTPEQREQFEASSHLLVYQLLRLKGGPGLLGRFLQTLPQTLNWQTAFFSIYKQHFAGPLEFEKWWMLNWVQFKNRQERETWPVAVALDRFESVLLTSMEVRLDANSIPQHRQATLQEFLQTADFPTQKEILGQKLQHLFFMSMNVPTQAIPLWSAYQRAIEGYLQKRSLNEYQPGLKSDPEQRLQALIKATLKALDELDFARQELKAGRTPLIPKDLTRQASR